MSAPSMPETTLAPDDPDAPAAPGHDVVEAPTAEAALAEVQRRHGASARIVRAEKVLRGGVGGFFQRELVQLTVDADGGASTATGRPLAPEDVHDPSVGQRFLAAVQEAMDADEADGEAPSQETLAELLDRRVGPQAADGSLLGAAAAARQPSPPGPDRMASSTTADGLDGALARLTADADAAEAGFGSTLRAAMGADAPRPSARVAGTGGAAWTDRLPSEPTATVPAAPAPVRPERSAQDVAADARRRAAERMRAAAAAAVQPSAAEPHDPAVDRATSTQPAPAPTPAPAGERPAWADRATTPDGPWSLDGLLRLGLPRALVEQVDARRPADDLAWFTAVADAIAPLCRDLPGGRSVVVGPQAEALAEAMDVDALAPGEPLPRRGHVAVVGGHDERTSRWLAQDVGTRWLHVVAGGEGWRGWLWDVPGAIGWGAPAALPEAVATAHELDLPLGRTAVDGRVVEAAPVPLAIALRGLLEVRS